MKSIEPIVDQVKEKANRSCDALELATSTVTSLPHFMAGGFNRATVDSVNLTIKGVARIIDLLIFAMEGIIVWLIHIFNRTYRCLLEFAVRGSIGVLSESVRVLGDFTKSQLIGIKSQLDSQISGINSSLDGVRKSIEGIGNVLSGGKVDIPSFTLSTDPLSNFQLPTTNIVSGLDALNGSIPSMDEIESKISGLATIPFEELRGFVKNIMSNVTFDENVLPVPPKNQISFCAKNLDLSILDNIARDLVKAAYIGLGIIFIVVLLMIAANALVIWFSHKRYKIHINRTTKTIQLITIREDKESVIEVIKIAEHPLISRWIIKGSKFFKNQDNRNLFRWFWDYILHKPALICLIIGITGVLGIYLQIAVLNVVKHNYKQPIIDTINNFGNSVENLVNSQLSSTSTQFASDSNNVISSLENQLNQDLFSWVNTTTTTLNNTLNTAVDEITTFIQNTFKDVPILLTVVQELVNCLILVKIEGIQTALTFIKENAFIGLPRVNDTILLINQNSMNEVVGQATGRLVGSPPTDNGTDNGEIGGEIGKIFDTYEKNLRAELPLFWVLISIWFIVILMGLIRVLWFVYQRRRKNKLIQNDAIARNSNSSSAPAQLSAQQTDLSQYVKSIKDEDKNKFDTFRSKMKAQKNNRSSQRNMINPTFPRNYDSPQPNDNDADDYHSDTYNDPFADRQYRLPPTLPPKPPKPLPLKRHDIRNKNPFESENYENY
ncbi:hypothetical protein C1645_750122 [Glomus cerebriforme]|uniref:Plasma membrane fusion protein PRM1 n=1 Tax=Glomus cerebriforme TaxID=658196 RepID=A0A397TKC5_9GLOM|nr:hypothetical protein C1645_750122 [Glomus cerebriforme]